MPADPFYDALVYEDDLPLGWEAIGELPAASRLASLNTSNEALLRVREGLEEPARGPEESHELAQEFNRLESKLNIILEVMAEWLRKQGDLPPVQPVRFNAHGIAWASSDLPAPGLLLRLELYLCTSFPKPLVLHGHVLRHETGAHGDVAVVDFEGLSPGLVDDLERLVFRRHRREVAQLRGQQRSGLGD